MQDYAGTPYFLSDGTLFYVDAAGHDQKVCDADGALAIAFDDEDGVLHKHGDYAAVHAWYENMRSVLSKRESTAGLAKALVLVSLSPNAGWVEEVNRCLNVAGAVYGLPSRLAALQEAWAEGLSGNPSASGLNPLPATSM